MLKTGGGAIVNTSSVAGHIAMPQSSIYVATKHAVEGLTKAVALEFAKHGIRVNSIAPGAIDTDMLYRAVGKEGDLRNWLVSLHPVGRFGASEEIAAAVLYLASDAAKFTTGTTLLVDGVTTITRKDPPSLGDSGLPSLVSAKRMIRSANSGVKLSQRERCPVAISRLYEHTDCNG
jgi:enoyl-[acyl-carrier-protein] reductase (NADH)